MRNMQSINYKTKFRFLVLVYGLLLLTWVNFNHSMFKCNHMPSKVWNGAEKLLFEQMLTGFIVHRCDTRGGWVDPSFIKRLHIFIYKIITRSVYTIKYNWHSTDRPSVLAVACFFYYEFTVWFISCACHWYAVCIIVLWYTYASRTYDCIHSSTIYIEIVPGKAFPCDLYPFNGFTWDLLWLFDVNIQPSSAPMRQSWQRWPVFF